ncbi:TetR/AcrR family transcriptional regulator [Glycomyces paridis]|uniref:TetR/AcrR family transcriptional regulator n=1 Tax=Glycomyces paridis TaxID=2126555 RepID=A0A4S8NVL5_9ACTN|nr:TetR/AcrR family transcriptional regulator [Glycomyces paridis]THV21690.1 TetR/AcrR family transcriptional regulator [Glycomyces paridis]
MAKRTLSTEGAVDIAVRLVDERGPAGLTLSAVAAEAGVATPSLYKHVSNLAELRALVSARVVAEIADRVGAAAIGRAADDAIRACMHAWRDYVKERPHRYAAMIQHPEPHTNSAGERLLDIVFGALRAYGLDAADTVHATRCVRAAVHGFTVLEAEGGFGLPENLDDSFDLMIAMVIAGLRART